jgi:hypothetical protein
MNTYFKVATLFLAICVLLGMALAVRAAELTSTFQWTLYTDTADGFILYRDSLDTEVGGTIPVQDTSVSTTYPGDGQCHNYWLRAFKGTMFSGNSAVAVACPPGINPPPPEQPPLSIGGFTITTTTVVTPNQ